MGHSMFIVSIVLAASAGLALAEQQTCYNLFGQADNSLRPCDPAADVSACCRKDDVCLSSGLCMSTASSWAGFIWANGCTDATQADPKCPNQCTQKTSVNAFSSFNVLQCTYPFNNGTVQRDPEWCCRSATDYDNCCNTPELVFNDTQNIGLFLTPGSTKAINPANTYVPASECSTYSTSDNATTADSTLASTSCPADHIAVVGGTVGGALGALLVGALAVIAFLLHGRRALKVQVSSTIIQRDDALKQVSDEKSLLAQMHQQQETQKGHFPNPMMAYHQSAAFGHSVSAAPGYGNGHIYGQYNNSMRSPHSLDTGISPPPAEMSAVKFSEIDGRAAVTELSVEEVQPTPLGSVHDGSVKSKTSS